MQHFLAIIICLLTASSGLAQIKINNPYKDKDKSENAGKVLLPDDSAEKLPVNGGDEADIRDVIKSLFAGMTSVDTAAIGRLFSKGGRLVSTSTDGSLQVITASEFAKMIVRSKPGEIEERALSIEINVDDNLASAWVPYELFVRGTFVHCGVDAFQLSRENKTWKITQISDTRRKDCESLTNSTVDARSIIGKVLDDWHRSASESNLESYFGAMSEQGYFLGTDATENWRKDEFYRFSKPYFDEGNAWEFIAKDRNIFISKSGNVGWFNELLDTWMGTCRGSGILEKDQKGIWKISQYSLAILVPNDVVQDYLKLIGQERR